MPLTLIPPWAPRPWGVDPLELGGIFVFFALHGSTQLVHVQLGCAWVTVRTRTGETLGSSRPSDAPQPGGGMEGLGLQPSKGYSSSY